MSNAVSWFEIYVSDIDRAAAFYSTVLGKELMDLPSPNEGQMKAFPMEEDGAGSSGTLIKHPTGQPGPGGTMVYFQGDDVATEEGRVEDAGGKVMMPKTSIGDMVSSRSLKIPKETTSGFTAKRSVWESGRARGRDV